MSTGAPGPQAHRRQAVARSHTLRDGLSQALGMPGAPIRQVARRHRLAQCNGRRPTRRLARGAPHERRCAGSAPRDHAM
eukprot:3047181-Prymnesium_polylepis.1